MKKLLSSLLLLSLLLLSLAACAPKDTSEVDIAYLSGSTGLGMAKMITDNKENEQYDFDGYDKPTDLRDNLLSADCEIDIAALPTNLAATIYNKTNGRYKVVALNTLGVLYLATTGTPIQSLRDLVGKTVYVPETAPGYVLHHVLTKNGIHVKTGDTDTTPGVTLDYTYTLETLPTEYLRQGTDVEIVLFPEPKMTAVQVQAANAGKTVSILFDMTEEWNKVEDTQLTQGCIVASTDFIENHPTLLKAFLEEYEASINYMEKSDNLESAADLAVSVGILPAKPIAMRAIPRCHIAYIDGNEMKATLSAYLAVLHTQNPQSVGGKLPDDAFYYVP